MSNEHGYSILPTILDEKLFSDCVLPQLLLSNLAKWKRFLGQWPQFSFSWN